jgi:hypothetical protein
MTTVYVLLFVVAAGAAAVVAATVVVVIGIRCRISHSGNRPIPERVARYLPGYARSCNIGN